MKLISITEHSKWLGTKFEDAETKWKLHCKRIVFGEQPLELWMFVPCKFVDGVWVVLEEPKEYNLFKQGVCNDFLKANICKEYQQAKERCLFEGITEIESDYIISSSDNNTIEDITAYNFTLTASAQKQIEL